MRTPNRKTLAALLPAIAGAAAVMTAGAGGNALGTYLNSAPEIGHIIAFVASDRGADGPGIAVHREDKSTCVLKPRVMSRFGGSFMIESQVTDAEADFRVHWAGRLTSNDGDDCGTDAILVMDRPQLDELAASAGGYGSGADRSPVWTMGMASR